MLLVSQAFVTRTSRYSLGGSRYTYNAALDGSCKYPLWQPQVAWDRQCGTSNCAHDKDCRAPHCNPPFKELHRLKMHRSLVKGRLGCNSVACASLLAEGLAVAAEGWQHMVWYCLRPPCSLQASGSTAETTWSQIVRACLRPTDRLSDTQSFS